MPAVERTRVLDPMQIPRPPNSWILYRSEKVALLPPPQPGTARSQADVSRIISQMWKNESPEVKAEYERRAEVKKLEHAALYPNYRYMPKSKELKEELKRSRDEQKKKKRKQKDDPHHTPNVNVSRPLAHGTHPLGGHQPLVSLPFPFLPSDASHYPQGGPSPPMSAADSPSPGSPHPQKVDVPNEHTRDQVAPTPGTNLQYLLSTNIHSLPTPSQHLDDERKLQPSPYRMTSNDVPAVRLDVDDIQHQSQKLQATQINQPAQVQEQQSAFAASMLSQNDPSLDYLSFDLQPFAAQNLSALVSQYPELQHSLSQSLNSNGADCYQMQIGPSNQSNLGYDAPGPLEIEIGPNFDISQWQWDGAGLDAAELYQSLFEETLAHNTLENTPCPSSNMSPPDSSSALLPAESDQGFRFDQFINFDPTFDFIPPTPAEQLQDTPARPPYAPPSGAAQSNKRRVAASWNPAFAISDPIDAT